MRRLVSALCLIFAGVGIGNGQSPDRGGRFPAFADGLLGKWDVTIREVDEAGKLMFEEHQTHVFDRGIGPQFLEERAITDGGVHSSTGLIVLSYDPKTNILSQHAFFGFQPGLRFTVEARLDDDNRSARGTIVTPLEPGFRTRRRIELKWVSPDEFRAQSFATYRGHEFLNEEQIYRRLKP